MADEDEIDVLGDFSFNSCFAQNNQGIPSCSSREDTVHPQWLLDSTEANWYDKETKNSLRDKGSPRRVIGDANVLRNKDDGVLTTWTKAERKILMVQMAKYGRNIKKISQAIKTKTEVEIQTFIDAEHGIHIEPSSNELDYDNQEDIPGVGGEEVIGNTTAKGTVPKHPFRRKNHSNSLLKPQILDSVTIPPSEVFYDEDIVIGSVESIGAELVTNSEVLKGALKYQPKVKPEKKIGNHRRKVSRSYDKSKRNSGKEMVKSPREQGRQRKDSSLSDDSLKSPKMQIILGSGQALPVSEGEEVIKIEKKKDEEQESDIEIDVDSDNEGSHKIRPKKQEKPPEEPIAVPLRKFEPMPRRQKKINLDGGGGYTIMHTESGDLYAVGAEPKRERPRRRAVHLVRCRFYGDDKPAPYEVNLSVSALIQMDFHAHLSRAEVMGLTGGESRGNVVCVRAYRPAAAAAAATHCDMDPVSQSRAAARLSARGLAVCGWHHSHPAFPAAPSGRDLRSQRGLQRALEWELPLLGFITSQRWPARRADRLCCLRIEEDESTPTTPVGYQLRVNLTPDITEQTLPTFLSEIRALRDFVQNNDDEDGPNTQLNVDMVKDVCPQANMTYLEKCISSIAGHMRSAGYAEDDPVTPQLIQAIRDIFR